jgi:hypothetical protein
MAPAPKVHLDPLALAETAELERVVKARNARRDQMQRAQALLAVATGQSFAAAARTAGFQSGEAVSQLVERFNVRRLAVLETAPGRGRKPTYDAPARQRILATVQRSPDRGTDGTATWSLMTLQQTLRTADPVFAHLGATTIRRILTEANYSYQQTRTWCPTGSALRVRKSGIVTVYDAATEEKKDSLNKPIKLGNQ